MPVVKTKKGIRHFSYDEAGMAAAKKAAKAPGAKMTKSKKRVKY